MASSHEITASERSRRNGSRNVVPQTSITTELEALQIESSLHMQASGQHYHRRTSVEKRAKKTPPCQHRPKQDSCPADQMKLETFRDVCKMNAQEDETDGVRGALVMARDEMKHYMHNLKEVFTHTAETVGHSIVGCVLSHQHSIDNETVDDHDVTTVDSFGNNVFMAHPSKGAPLGLGMHIRPHHGGLGYCVARVFQNSIADEACLVKSDILTHVNEVDISNRDIQDVLQIFLRTSKKFHLKLLRQNKEGVYMEITIELTIMGKEDKTVVEIEAVVYSPRILSTNHSSKELFFIQDLPNKPQRRMYAEDDGRLYMAIGQPSNTSQCADAFVLDHYFIPRSSCQELCAIRQASSGRVFDCNLEKLVAPRNRMGPECLFIKRMFQNNLFMFESCSNSGKFVFANSDQESVITSCSAVGSDRIWIQLGEGCSDAMFKLHNV